MTDEQAIVLSALEQRHGRVLRIPDDSDIGEAVLRDCLTGTRVYRCVRCMALFAIEPDGETGLWLLTPVGDAS